MIVVSSKVLFTKEKSVFCLVVFLRDKIYHAKITRHWIGFQMRTMYMIDEDQETKNEFTV